MLCINVHLLLARSDREQKCDFDDCERPVQVENIFRVFMHWLGLLMIGGTGGKATMLA